MWRRLMRTSMAPRRPVLFSEQWPLALVTALAVAIGIAAVVVWLLR